jgi:predicted dehydrogenase
VQRLSPRSGIFPDTMEIMAPCWPTRMSRYARRAERQPARTLTAWRTSVAQAVYVPLLNGLHYKWAVAALRAGKHVLLEKPLTANAEEARALAALARERRLVLFEAYHWAYHPLAARWASFSRQR